jgi:hypothetical protein
LPRMILKMLGRCYASQPLTPREMKTKIECLWKTESPRDALRHRALQSGRLVGNRKTTLDKRAADC